MFSRNRLIITAALLCHALLTPPLLTSQLLHLPPGPAAQAQAVAAPPAAPGEAPSVPVTIQANEQEKKGDVYTLRGDVEISAQGYVFRGDQVTYDGRTGEVTATGNITFRGQQLDENLTASRAEYNVRTQTGRFYDVTGTIGLHFRGRNVVLTSSTPFAFEGKMVEKTGPNRYVVHNGFVTSCALPNPKWTFNAGKVIVDVGDRARIYHSTFRIKGVPILYLPFAQHPVDRLGRQSGFLIPTLGQSSRKGTIIGESFYWAINRSLDATIGAEYFSHRGWAQHGEFRARPSDNSYLDFRYFGVLDRGITQDVNGVPTRVDQGGEDIHLNSEINFAHGFRGVASINYLSSFLFRLAFTETFAQAIDSEVKSQVFLSNNYKGYSFNALAGRYQNFESTQQGDLITILHMPSVSASSVDRSLGRSPFFWGFDVAVEGVSRREPNFVTDAVVGRFDVRPRLSLPLLLRGWSVRPEVALRDTYYSERQLPVPNNIGVPVDDPVNRRALESSVEIRPPALSRIYAKPLLGRKIKHVIEPRLVWRDVSGVNNFPNIIRFDARDILSDTNELEYGVINRIYGKRVTQGGCEAQQKRLAEKQTAEAKALGAKPAAPEAPWQRKAADGEPEASCESAQARELLTWELKQKYFFDPYFGGAIVNGKRNVLTTTVDFSGIAFLTEPRVFSPVESRLLVNTSANTDVQWILDYDTVRGRINSSTALVDYRLGEVFVGGSHAFLHVPGEIYVSNPIPGPDRFNQFRFLVGYGHPNKRGINAAANIGWDANFQFLQYGAFQASYNWDCCGVSMEYRRFSLGSVRNENQFRFAFTLSNIGTFGNLKRQERIF
jgi:LPS-assembly protein